MGVVREEAARFVSAVSPYVISLREGLAAEKLTSHGTMELGDLRLETMADEDTVWAIVRRPERGGVALRLVYAPGANVSCSSLAGKKAIRSLSVNSAIGKYRIEFKTDGDDLHRLRVTVALTPSVPLLMPFVPRDLIPLDASDDPLGAKGRVEAGQRGLNTGLLYFHLDEPAFGNVLYVQNLTALNAYFEATKTKPDGAVGGIWPELGYLLPTPTQSGTPPTDPLPAGAPVTLSDAILVFRDAGPCDEFTSAREFIQMLGAVYSALDLPTLEYHDWVWRAEKTLKDLNTSAKATIRHYGHRYAHPYTASEYPDSMVQLSLLAAMRDYSSWRAEPAELEVEFLAGLEKFYDPKIKAIRRYLPNVGKDKNADAVDSWYLYHPLLNLARLALKGDEKAKSLFLRSVDFGIKAAKHFKYQWPVQYDITDFSVITATAPADGLGQTDVGGIYAWVMLQAFELTGQEHFIEEARLGLKASEGMRFNLNYQANLTAWGAAACLRMWRITNEERYRTQSYVYLASFFHNCVMWESDIAGAKAYSNFLGVTCLQDAPYMAIYECFDSVAAFEYCLRDSGPELEPAARLLITEYCKYAVDRAWYYYPDALPRELLASEIRNGHIDPELSFPLEDLYVDGQPAGQVGQEIYGAGAALVFASRFFHPVSDAPFRLFCDHFIMASERTGDRAISMSLAGGEGCAASLSFIALTDEDLPRIVVKTAEGGEVKPQSVMKGRIAYCVPAEGRIIVSWG